MKDLKYYKLALQCVDVNVDEKLIALIVDAIHAVDKKGGSFSITDAVMIKSKHNEERVTKESEDCVCVKELVDLIDRELSKSSKDKVSRKSVINSNWVTVEESEEAVEILTKKSEDNKD